MRRRLFLSLSAAVGLAALGARDATGQGANFNLRVRAPSPGGLAGRKLFVAVAVSSTFELRSVRARVADRETELQFNPEVCVPTTCEPSWAGTVSLLGLPRGSQTLTITATDVFGNGATTETSFFYDQPPVLEVHFPLEATVAQPTLRVAFTCTDDGPEPCLVRVWGRGKLLLQTRGSRDTELSFAEFDRSAVFLQFEAIDSVKQRVEASRTVYVEASPRLERVATFTGPVLDVSSREVLYVAQGPQGDELRKREYFTREDALLWQVPAGHPSPRVGFLSPRGAIFITSTGAALTEELFDLRDGQLASLGRPDSGTFLVVKGHYAIWCERPKLYRRDLLAGETVLVSNNAGNIDNDVAANGDVVFWSNDYKIYRYRAGQTTLIASDPNQWCTFPLTDGISVIYRQHSPCCGPESGSIRLFGDFGQITVAPERPGWPALGQDYQVNNGWAAFTRIGGGQLQVWRRSPGGQEEQISFFGTSSRIVALGPGGEVAFSTGLRVHLARAGQIPREVGLLGARVFWFDGQPYELLGRELFRLNTGPTPARVDTPRVMPDGRFSFFVRAGEGQRVVIQASTDLRQWENVATNQFGSYTFQFIEPADPRFGVRFYRAVQE
jgi:hypothetical protein